jgi:hypothetical protein
MVEAKVQRVTAGSMIANGGLTNFVRAVRFAARYSEACDGLGKLCSLDEYREFRGMSQAQAYREQRAWRRCVGKDLTVLDVISKAALRQKGWTEDERVEALGRWLSRG